MAPNFCDNNVRLRVTALLLELTNFNTLRARLIQPVAESKIPDDMEYYASDTDDEDCVAQIQHFPRQ